MLSHLHFKMIRLGHAFHSKLTHMEHAFHIAYLGGIVSGFEDFHRYAAGGLLFITIITVISHIELEE